MQSLRILGRQAVNVSSKRSFQTTTVMPIKAGDKLPSVDLFENNPDGKVNTGSLKGKTLIIGVPGAFTPTCHNEHVPSILSNADALKAKGVDNVLCVSVNDPFVMKAWGESLKASNKVRFLADTTGALAKALDVQLDVTPVLGNVRNKRFTLVAENGVVKAVNIEPDGVGLTCTRGKDVLSQI